MKYNNFSLCRLITLMSSACLLLIYSVSIVASEQKDYSVVFTAAGYASINAQKGKTFDLKMLNAIKASKIEAYRELAEQIYGVSLSSENSMKDSRLQKDRVEVSVSGVIQGASVVRSYHKGGFYITELELDMKRLPAVKSLNVVNKRRIVTKVATSDVYY